MGPGASNTKTNPVLLLCFLSAVRPAKSFLSLAFSGFSVCDFLGQAGALEGDPYRCVSVELGPFIAELCCWEGHPILGRCMAEQGSRQGNDQSLLGLAL